MARGLGGRVARGLEGEQGGDVQGREPPDGRLQDAGDDDAFARFRCREASTQRDERAAAEGGLEDDDRDLGAAQGRLEVQVRDRALVDGERDAETRELAKCGLPGFDRLLDEVGRHFAELRERGDRLGQRPGAICVEANPDRGAHGLTDGVNTSDVIGDRGGPDLELQGPKSLPQGRDGLLRGLNQGVHRHPRPPRVPREASEPGEITRQRLETTAALLIQTSAFECRARFAGQGLERRLAAAVSLQGGVDLLDRGAEPGERGCVSLARDAVCTLQRDACADALEQRPPRGEQGLAESQAIGRQLQAHRTAETESKAP